MNKIITFGLALIVLVTAGIFLSTIQAQADTIRYVKENGSGDGTSWVTASGTLQAMIDEVYSLGGGEVWVASGTYIPTTIINPGSPRSAAFQMKDKVEIYGGFPGSGSPSWSQRNWNTNTTVCSGEIGDPGTTADNCYHVFYHPDVLLLSNGAVLDGFTISDGYANGNSAYDHDQGGGMFNDGNTTICRPVISNCIFRNNYALWGGAVHNDLASPKYINCTFFSNDTPIGSGWGGGVLNTGPNAPEFLNCTFSNNTASIGGAICNALSTSPMIINCILWGNTQDQIWNDIFGAKPVIKYCDIDQAGYPANGNIRQNPLWINPANGDFHLQGASPCIDQGTNTATFFPDIDFEGDSRIVGGTADMGVDETTYTCELIISSGTGGSVTTPGEGIYYYGGTVVVVVAEASPCYKFLNWTGDVSTIAEPDSASTTITMRGDYSIQANFVLGTAMLTMSNDGNGTTNPAAGIHGPYNCGTEIGINAIPNLYYSFDQWTGDTVHLTGPVMQASNSVIIPDTDITLTATFAVNKCDLTTSSSVGGSVMLPGEGTYSYDCGTEVAIVAEASSCYSFVKWTGSGSPSIANPGSPNTTVTMEGNRTIHASFVLNTYDLTIDQTGQCCNVNVVATGVDVTIPAGDSDIVSIQCGDSATLTASGCNFDSWSGIDGGDVIGGNPGTIVMDEPKTLTASCSEGHTITIECIPRIGQRSDGQYLLNVAVYNAGSAVYSPGNGVLVSGPVAYGPYAGNATFTTASGKFTYEIPDLVNPGTYVVVVSAWSTLENVKDEVSITGNMTVDMGTLISGNYSSSSTATDAEINNFDMSPLANGWGCSTGMACYDNNKGADADESGVINNFDMSPLANNWGVYGPIDIN